MRPNSFKVGQKVKRIETDGSLSETVMTVIGIHRHAVWVRIDYAAKYFSPDFRTCGANELELVRDKPEKGEL